MTKQTDEKNKPMTYWGGNLKYKQQTAVEWLYSIFKQREPDKFDWEQAKQMEKHQIIDAWIATDNELQRLAAEQYYNKTYGK